MMPIDRTNSGKRVELIHTSDDHTRLRSGAKGTYQFANISSMGIQHNIRWDDGSLLMLIEGEDNFKFVEG